jgi:pyruvate-ferredoxin/flavodoxin oxidoreductase
VDCGIWPLYRFDPRRIAEGKPPLVLDSGPPKAGVADYMRSETRFRMVEKMDPKRFQRLLEEAQNFAARRVAVYQQLAGLMVPAVPAVPAGEAAAAAADKK